MTGKEKEKDPLLAEVTRLVDEFTALVQKEWVVGAKDRGMGHYSYGVITVDEELVVKCDHQIIAEHIVQVHNAFRKQ